MDRRRLTLNDPAFAGRLRQTSRSASYVRRPTQWPAKPQVIEDINQSVAPQVTPPVVKSFTDAIPPQGYRRQRFAAQPTITKQPQPVPSTSVSPIAKAISQEAEAPKRKKQPKLLYAMASLIFVVGLVVSVNGLLANHHVAAQVKQLASKHTGTAAADAPSTNKPSSSAVANYFVAPNLPRYIDIAKLKVHARVLSLGITSSGALAAPGNVYDAGWYNASAQPGQPGAMLVDGHISSWTTPGVFYGLTKLIDGDDITVTRGDGKVFTYTVVKTALVDAKSVDMASMLVSADTAKPGLNLISCSGDVIPGTSEFDKRITIYAVEN